MSSTASIQEIEINDDLEKCGVTRFAKEGTTLYLESKGKPTIFKIQSDGLFSTLQDFKDNSKGKIDPHTQERIITILSRGDYYPNILRNGNTTSGDIHNDSESKEQCDTKGATSYVPIDPSNELDPFIPGRDYAEYAIRTTKKTVKQEDSLVRQILYVGLSKDSGNPLNLAVLAPTSEGKTHAVTETLQYFPKKDLWKIGTMSPKVIIRQSGVLVYSNNKPLEGKIKELKKQIRVCQVKKDHNQEEDLQEQLRQVYQEAKVLIDLSGKLLVFLEPPHVETWSILKPILFHDDFEIEHPYVYEVEGMGFKVKKVVTRGWPACIFCSAKNESKWPAWPEIQSRFLITSPNMIAEKYHEGNMLTAQKKDLPKLAQQALIVSDREIELAKKSVQYLIQEMKNSSINGSDSPTVWIPYARLLGNVLPAEKGTDNRTSNRIFSFLIIIVLSRAHLRGKLQYGSEKLVIADIKEDLHEVLHITQNLSGIPTYKLKVFKMLVDKYKTKSSPDKSKDGSKEERIIGVTTTELCKYYNELTGKTITTNNMETYLKDFISNGLIDEEDSIINAKQKIYYPIVDAPEINEQKIYQQLIKKSSISDRMDNILQHSQLIVPKKFKYIPENWLELEIFDLLECPVQLDRFEIYNENGEQLCICRFINQYQGSQKINGYFSNAIFYKNSGKIFGSLQYISDLAIAKREKLSTGGRMDNIFIFNGNDIDQPTGTDNINTNDTQITSRDDLDGICNGNNDTHIDIQDDTEQLTNAVEYFFSDESSLSWPLPEHSIEESPCYHIIETDELNSPDTTTGTTYYRCKIHPMIWNFDFEEIEYHCKYQEPGIHRTEILRLLHSDDNTADAFAQTGLV